jgi:hypothetical protein
MSGNPYLYEEGPAELHTATPRRRRGLLAAILLATTAIAVAMVVLLPVLTGSPERQTEQVTSVFFAALAAGDPDTAYSLLCTEERARLTPGQVAAAYVRAGTGRVVSVQADRRDGVRVERVVVAWSGDGSTSTITAVNESGARICGTRPGG